MFSFGQSQLFFAKKMKIEQQVEGMWSVEPFATCQPMEKLLPHRDFFSKSYQIKPKSDCIYHFPIDLEQKCSLSACARNQSVHGKYNLIVFLI